MTSMIRWGGLLGFVVVTGLIALITHFFMDSWIKFGVESVASSAVGAEVDIQHVTHSYSPLGVTLTGVQITNPAQPSHNQLQLESVSAALAFSPLLMNKIIIDQLSVDGVEFNVERKYPGKVYHSSSAATEAAAAETSLGEAAKLPSVDDVLARSPLKTTAAAEQLQSHYEQQAAELQAQYQKLPTQEQLAEYERQINAITGRKYASNKDLLAGQKELKTLQDSLREQQQNIKRFTRSIAAAREQLQSDTAALKLASQQDYDLLKGIVGGDSAALGQLTEMLFGPQAKSWASYLFSAFDLVVPMLQSQKEQEQEKVRAEGRWVNFGDSNSLPDFLVRKAGISIRWQGQSFTSQWRDITAEHERIGRPTVFKVASENTPQWRSLLVNGEFRFLKDGLQASQAWELADVLLSDVAFGNAKALHGNIQKAILNSSGTLNIEKGLLDGSGLIKLADTVLQTDAASEAMNSVAQALQQLSTLTMKAGIKGELDAPQFSLGSDLDRQLGKLLVGKVDAKGKARLADLQSKLDSRVQEAQTTPNAGKGQWQQWEQLADNRSASLQKLLEAETGGAVDQQKNKLEGKLKNKLLKN